MEESQSLGEYLRSQRQGRGLSLKHISDNTKITLNHLQAMESGCYDQLPAETYLRGFLVCYAELLDLPVEKILEMYRAECPGKQHPAPNISAVFSPQSSPSLPVENKSIVVLLLVLVFAFASGGVIWWSAPDVEEPFATVGEVESVSADNLLPLRDTQATVENTIDSIPLPTTAELANDSEVSNAMISVAVASAATIESVATEAVSAQPQQMTDPIITLPAAMQLNALRPVSIEVTIDGRPAQSYSLQAGSRLRWQIRKSVVLEIAPADAVLVSFADKDVTFDNSGRYVFPPIKN